MVNAQKTPLGILSKKESLLADEWALKLEKIIKNKILTLEEKKVQFDLVNVKYLLNDNNKILLPSILVEAIEDFIFPLYYKKYYTQINFIIEKNCQKIDYRLFNGQQVD